MIQILILYETAERARIRGIRAHDGDLVVVTEAVLVGVTDEGVGAVDIDLLTVGEAVLVGIGAQTRAIALLGEVPSVATARKGDVERRQAASPSRAG